MAPHLTALRCIFLLCTHHGTQLSAEQLAAGARAMEERPGGGLAIMARLLKQGRLQTRLLQARAWTEITALGHAYPALVSTQGGHWMIVAGVLGAGPTARLAVLDPALETMGLTLFDRETFERHWNGTIILARPAKTLLNGRAKFGLGWFVEELLPQKAYLRDVAIAAITSSLIALTTPLLTHVIIDKVIPYRATRTLFAVVAICLVVTVFDSLFGYVRQRLMIFIGTKVDASVASKVFAHLLSLPMPFFEATTAGVLTRHMQQTDKLRQFLTGRLLQTVLDCVTLPILLVLLASYDLLLFLVVIGFAGAIAAVIGVLIPSFKHSLNRLYQAEGARQTHLVESIHGMRTIKSLAMEGVRQTEWDDSVAASVRGYAVVGRIGAVAHTLTSTLERLMQISVLALGASSVFSGRLSVGGLVAFTMLASRVSGPLLQIVALINEYQETALSVRMLATVMDHPPERPAEAKTICPPIAGDLSFEQVSFRYPGAVAAALDRVSFRIEPGQVIGVVGRSGSGKTTLIRLIQGIETAQAGMIRLGGADLRHIDLGHLRRNVGVVLQDSFLFRGSIRDNIAASSPNASLGDIVHAATLAGADEFIDRLPLGYETHIAEGAVNFSGGQRQRLSIARALLPRPSLLIFDEATSALDPESEAILQANLKEIARGRTMIIVSHRLSSLVHADAILVLAHGQVVDMASHPALLERCDPYRSLWQQQTQHMLA